MVGVEVDNEGCEQDDAQHQAGPGAPGAQAAGAGEWPVAVQELVGS
jgi:hypothetical protein